MNVSEKVQWFFVQNTRKNVFIIDATKLKVFLDQLVFFGVLLIELV